MIQGILKADDLLAVTDYDRIGDLTRAFDQQGIKYFLGKGGKPWTTIDLINKAGGLFPPAAGAGNQPTYSPDDV